MKENLGEARVINRVRSETSVLINAHRDRETNFFFGILKI